MRLLKLLFLAFVVCLTTVVFVHISVAEEENAKTIRAVRIEPGEAPVIDGKLDDKCWEKTDAVTDFIQFEPSLGNKPKEATKVSVLFDRENLYVGFECLKEKPDQVMGSQTRRDSFFFQDDYVEVFLDTYHDRRNCYGFAVNCLGTQVDRRIANEGSTGERGPFGDRSRAWDCAWEAKAAKTDRGWSAEMAIPFSELRFKKKTGCVWGINFWRGNEEFDEGDTWSNVGEKELSVSRFGCLEGLTPEDLVVTRPLELKPYATVKPRISPEREVEPDAGLDIRYPSSTITADFTLNPDFAQVEADPEQINLEDVEQRFPEKRPFFQEGMELFQMPIELFYTRRAGIKDLLFGAKVAGKLGKNNIALLDCQSDDTIEYEEGEVVEELDDETKNNHLVLRTQRDIGTNSSIGFIGVNKQKSEGDYNRTGGVDFNMALPADIRLIGQYAGSWLPDKSDDAFILSMNGQRKSLNYSLGYGDIGPDFSAEPGYIPRIDRKGFKGRIGYEYTREARIFRSLRGRIGYERLENHKGIRTNDEREINMSARISDFFFSPEFRWYYHVNEEDETIFYTDKTLGFFSGWFPPRWVSVRMESMYGKWEDADIFFIGPELSIIPTEKLRLEVGLQRMDWDKVGERLQLNRRLMVNYQFSHKMFFRTTFEKTRDRQSIFALYAWEFRPENNFYIVYIDNKEMGNIDRIIFVKISYLLKWNIF